MTKSTFFTVSAFAFFAISIFSCSKDVTEGSIYGPSVYSNDNHPTCYECSYSVSIPTASSTICNINDTIVNVINNGVPTTFPLNGLSFEKYIEQLEEGGATCTFLDTPLFVTP